MNEVRVQESGVLEEVHENVGLEEQEEFERECRICYHCGEVIEEWESYFEVEHRGGSELYCEECFNRHCFRCDDCGYNYPSSNRGIIYRGEWVCNRCSSDYNYCESCDSNVHYMDFNSDRDCCYDCDREQDTGVDDYHSTSYWQRVGECKPCWRGIWRGIGVELEIDHSEKDYDRERDAVDDLRSVCDNIRFEHDGSLDYGFEIITQPHTVEEFYNIDWAGIMRVCRRHGYQSHSAETCGLHIHFSREMFGSTERKQANAISKLIHFFETYWDDIIKVSRRTHSQAEQYAAKYGVKGKNEVKKLISNKNYDRYFAVNNTNYATVEIRILRGTLRLETFFACIDFCVNLVNNSRRVTWAEIDNAAKWLKGIRQGTKDYIISRDAFREVM